MFMLLGSGEKKVRKEKEATSSSLNKVKEIFSSGRFPVVTTQAIEGRPIAKVLGLVCCRGFDSDEAFFGMAAMALKKGAQGIIGYSENVAFHPDGSKYFSCFGTAVMFSREARGDLLSFQPTDTAEITRQLSEQYSRDTIEPAEATQTVRQASQAYQQDVGQPSEEDDPVLQRLLASKRPSANSDWQ